MSADAVVLNAKADACRIVALFLHLPTSELVAGVNDGSIAADARAIVQDAGFALEADGVEALEGFADAEATLDELRCDFTDLFTNPSGPKIPIYEALFRGRDDFDTSQLTFISPNALSAEQFYRSWGLSMGGSDNNSADHMAAECEFAAFLLGKWAQAVDAGDAERAWRAEASLAEFRAKHLDKWAPEFFARTGRMAQTAAYRAVAQLGALVFRP